MASERNLVLAFERQDLAGFVRRREVEPEALDNGTSLLHLLCVRLSELALAAPQRVLEANTDVATHRRAHRRDLHLAAPGTKHRPAVMFAEQAVRRALHVLYVLGVRSDSTQQPEYGLDEQGRLDQPL